MLRRCCKALASPTATYNRLVGQGTMRSDPRQQAALVHIERLYRDLEDYARHPTPRDLTGASAAAAAAAPATRGGFFSSAASKAAPAAAASSGALHPLSEVKGLYMYGGVGTGKTHLMDLFYNEAPLRKQRVHFHQFMLDVHKMQHSLRSSGGKARDGDQLMMELAGRICSDAELLCFDEMVVADVADAMILRRLFNAMYKVGICCVFTSNRHPDDLYKNGLNRESFLPFVRMLKDRCFVHDINSDTDYRLTGRRAEVYFDGSLAGSEERFDRLFNDITQGRPTKERIMRVFGRDVVAPRTVGGVARFHFLEICGSEAAKSAADYGVIAQVFHTVFLEGVPRLGGPDSDERRRFMTLIDELYQAKCKVVLLGETPERISLPGTDLMGGSAVGGEETLYAGKLIDADEGAFQLQRTVSRLFEMRSQEYLESAHAGTGELSALEGAEPE